MASTTFHRILVATDGSKIGSHAVGVAIELAKNLGSALSIVSVSPPFPVGASAPENWVPKVGPPDETPYYRDVLTAAIEKARSAGLSEVTSELREGVVVDELLAYIHQQPVDLVVLGSRGLSTTKRLVLGSVSDALVHHLTVPILVVHDPPSV